MAARKKTFSITKAVKANARERVGTPPPQRVLPENRADQPPRHKETLHRLLERVEQARREEG